MYLSKRYGRKGIHYVLCESYREGKIWKHREIIDLGPSPEDFIEYGGGNSFYFKESLEESFREAGSVCDGDELERIFMPFLDPGIRQVIERFQGRARKGQRRPRIPNEAFLTLQRQLHPFDKRRLHYLRFGRVNIGNLDARPLRFVKVLLDKSRDEIEHLMEEMEKGLPSQENRAYMYTALELERHFNHLLTRYHPSALDPEKVDQYFVENLCRLNRDEVFFQGVKRPERESLHPYLVRYLILYFDSGRGPVPWWEDEAEGFLWTWGFHRGREAVSGRSMAEKEACLCLGIRPEDFEKMGRRELVRCYRRLAKETHPDKGGEDSSFVRIKEAYECLLKFKS